MKLSLASLSVSLLSPFSVYYYYIIFIGVNTGRIWGKHMQDPGKIWGVSGVNMSRSWGKHEQYPGENTGRIWGKHGQELG